MAHSFLKWQGKKFHSGQHHFKNMAINLFLRKSAIDKEISSAGGEPKHFFFLFFFFFGIPCMV